MLVTEEVSNFETSITGTFAKLQNIKAILSTFGVLKLETSRLLSEAQSLNIFSISSTISVLKLTPKLNLEIEAHPRNIPHISVTFVVSNPPISKAFTEVTPENISIIF